MPRTLVSDWKRVATSGKTADGRTINPQDLRDMANAYDPAVYTAVIWFEHIRYMGNFGSVAEVKAEDIDGGKVALFAKLAPNDRLLQLNKEAQKLFTSIEIQPEFARAARNIPQIDVLPAQGINVYDILRRRKLVLTRAAIAAIEERFK